MTDADTAALLQRGYRYALSLTHDGPKARDLLHDAWANVLTSKRTITKPYLFRAVRNRWIDGYRRDQVLSFEVLDGDVAMPSTLEDRLCLQQRLERSLATLRPEEREALYLTAVEGWTAQEVSDQTGRPRNTILSLIHRAKLKIRSHS